MYQFWFVLLGVFALQKYVWKQSMIKIFKTSINADIIKGIFPVQVNCQHRFLENRYGVVTL